jgi:adenine-specific DNA-methyltransferase
MEKIEKFEIYQRRFLGNKLKVMPLIEKIIENKIKTFKSFCDIFAGTGTVGWYFNKKNVQIISNDLLYSNYIPLRAFLSDEKFDEKKIKDLLNEFNSIKDCDDNYVSINFGEKYFCRKNAKIIGEVRERIRKYFLNGGINLKEKAILLTSLLYAMDKIANTVGHYDAYRDIKDIPYKPLKFLMPDIDKRKNKSNLIFNMDANILIREIECDVLYIDPPYNSRQYSDTYHLPENILRWEKPELYGKAMKFDRSALKSKYSSKEAARAFADLIENAKCKYILFSYNNMANKGHSRSNARISDEKIMEILTKKGDVEIFEMEHKEFTTGKSKRGDNKERIFFVKVKN